MKGKNLMDNYDILGLKKEAYLSEIEDVYKLLIERYDPKNYKEGPNREWALKQIHEVETAYKALIDSKRMQSTIIHD